MTKIEQLRQQLDGGDYPLTRADIRELLNLVELQHEAIIKRMSAENRWPDYIIEATQAFENWNKP